jgi:hypothetical protein
VPVVEAALQARAEFLALCGETYGADTAVVRSPRPFDQTSSLERLHGA